MVGVGNADPRMGVGGRKGKAAARGTGYLMETP
jgi:hypothetical protein